MTDRDQIASLDAIAVIGMAGRFPGAANVTQFWRNLASGVESVSFFGRTELAAQGVPAELLDDPLYVRANAILDGIEMFDAEFFGFTPREAEITDPQHRIFLECACEALEDSGYDPEAYQGQIGVYAGAGPSSYLLNCVLGHPGVVRSAGALPLQLGNNKDYVPLRVSYKLQLRGPSLNINTACSSSLVAVHVACQSLIDQQCDIALAGGVGIQVPQRQGYLYSPNGISSPDGHCRAFDARAQGTVSGNGAGIVVLKRYAEAVADGDAIRAVILGSAINNDGGGKVGFTAPSLAGQARVIGEALAMADADPGSLGYVEAHGTGTPLGDPIEVAALTEAFRAHTPRTGFCALGSVKTNVGHLDEAAGVAGLIKTVLALQHGEIPPSLHFQHPNPQLDLDRSPFYVPTRLTPWPRTDAPRRAAVSSFGIGGTNAHAVLQEAPPPGPDSPSRSLQLLLLSARTETALDCLTVRLAEHLRQGPDCPLADIAYSLQVGRKTFAHRRMVLCRDRQDAIAALDSGAADRCVTARAPASARPLVFMFPGQGSQYCEMGRTLYRTEPLFRSTVDRCAELLIPLLGIDLRDVLYPSSDRGAADKAQIDQTLLAQPALFTVEYALAQLLIDWGIRPQAMIGHSIGEYVAACLAGVFSWEDGLRLVAARGKLMQKMPAGGMLAVELAEQELRPLLGDGLALALANAPNLSVAAGGGAALTKLEAALSRRGIACRRLHTSHAFHSEAMDPVLQPFTQRVRQISLSAPTIPFLSNLTGQWITAAQATDPDYWARQLRSTVRFSDGVRLLLQDQDRVLLEVGPGRTLGGLVARHPECAAARTVISTMRHAYDPRDDVACLLEAVGRLWVAGACQKPVALYANEKRRRVALPTYPFERQRFWLDSPAVREAAAPERDIADWFYLPVWQRGPAVVPATPPKERGDSRDAGWLVFLDTLGLGAQLVDLLRRRGRRVFTAAAGADFARSGDASYTLDPRRPDHYRLLLGQLPWAGAARRNMVHLWSVTSAEADPATRWDAAQELGFFSLLFLMQAANALNLADDLALQVVSSNMQPVLGDEVDCPEKATLLGLVRVAPKEFPGIFCRSIDLIPPAQMDWERSGCTDALMAALASDDPAPSIAIRDGVVWRQAFTPYSLPAPATPAPRLRQGGTYLITGGLGSMGLAIARFLANEAKARLVLLGRTGLPPEPLGFDPVAATDLVQSIAAAAASEAALFDVDGDSRLHGLLHAFCAGLIGRFMAECGVALETGMVLAQTELRQRLQLLPAFERFLDFLLRSLAEDGIVTIDQQHVTVRDDAILRALPDLRNAILSDYPQFAGLVRLLEHCTAHYRRALSGEIPSITVLYPDGTSDLLDQCGRDTPAYASDGIYLQTVARLVADIAANRQGQPLRIIEVGGGSGSLTRTVLKSLKGHPVEYTFTDLGASFVRAAEQASAAGGIDSLRFGVLDISADAGAQGYPRHSFDLVLGYNVVHATAAIEQAIGQLRRLLAPGGLLMLVETTRLRRWDEMVWGLTEGWWHFTDRHLRSASPLIGLDAWEDVLRGQGFDSVISFPRGAPARRAGDVGLLLARQPADPGAPSQETAKTATARAALRDLRESGAEVMVLRADVADEAQMRAALSEMYRRFGPPDGIIHTAGILGQGLIHDRTPSDIRAVFEPKAVGLMLLDRLLAERGIAPDFLVLCSSLAAVAPILGQVDYCAANAFLDAYAAYRSRSGATAAISIDWGFWQELGMIEQAQVPAAAKQGIIDEINRSGRSGAGIEAFRRILAGCSAPQIVVAPDTPDGLLLIGDAARRSTSQRRPVFHPLIVECLIGADGTETCISRLATQHWVLDEHRPFGKAVLPGTAYLELARAALDRDGSGKPVQWSNVYFLSPLLVEDGETREVRTILTRRDGQSDFVVISRVVADADAWQEHARGEIGYLTQEPPSPVDMAGLEQNCRTADIPILDRGLDPDGERFAVRVRSFTPHWRVFERLRLGQSEGLASLRLPPAFAAESDALPLHPALADMALGFLAIVDGFETGVPFCLKRVRLWRPLPPGLHSHARAMPGIRAAERSYDATVFDDEGRVLLDVTGFTLRTIDRAAGAEPVIAAGGPRNFSADVEVRGNLASVGVRPEPRHPPAPGEVEIEVAAAGLNFIEVLYALGLLPEAPGGGVRFGLECAGTIAAIGDGVEGLHVGDEVFGFAPRAVSRFTTTAASTIALKPRRLSLSQAATLPAALTTAYYALITRGRLKRGERILIHAASGGVGLAAVNIAQWRGAEIFATAGSPEKRDYLRGRGIHHVWDSRSLDFAGQLLEVTAGQGVDLVLNSLGGEFIPASLSVLGRYGRFLELGKRDILRNGALALAPFEKHLSFTAIDVGTDLPDFDLVWRQVVRGIGREVFEPLPYREFPVNRLSEAFEHMAQAKHIGKVVIAIAGIDPPMLGPRRNRGRPLDDILGRGVERPSAGPAAGVGSGKIGVRTAPRKSGHVRPALTTPYRAPGDAAEAAIVAIWEELLGVFGIGADDNFFELNGDSLLAAQVTARLYAALQVKLPLSSVFEHPTAARLAARIEELRQAVRELATIAPGMADDSEVEHEL